jgi:hypothetical protein
MRDPELNAPHSRLLYGLVLYQSTNLNGKMQAFGWGSGKGDTLTESDVIRVWKVQ